MRKLALKIAANRHSKYQLLRKRIYDPKAVFQCVYLFIPSCIHFVADEKKEGMVCHAKEGHQCIPFIHNVLPNLNVVWFQIFCMFKFNINVARWRRKIQQNYICCVSSWSSAFGGFCVQFRNDIFWYTYIRLNGLTRKLVFNVLCFIFITKFCVCE